ncbi:MAG: PQQ-dependent sugar dehydrogenase [Anaerolineae bacterium]|nr:PQQ-dependent sugar dehydrogenase [Anaerolineae bacterium]
MLVIGLLIGCGSTEAAEPPLPTIVADSSPSEAIEPTATQLPLTITPAVENQQPDDNPEQSEPPTAQPTEVDTALSQTPPTETPAPRPTQTPTTVVQRPAIESISIDLVPVATGLAKPLYLTHAGDGSNRLFVLEQTGRILIIENGEINPTPFLDIVSIVGSDANEQGLLGLAFHPNYAENGLFFINYTNKQGDTVIARYAVSDDANSADPNSGEFLLTIGQPYRNHNGGQVAFGPDGYLYVGMGDGGSANDPENRAQDLGALLGKILRLDVDAGAPYGVPESNPFVADSQARPEIWSYGWRNPWRFSFDTATGDLYVADVGQNQYEEVHVELDGTGGGQNYGWRIMEGLHCFNPTNCDPQALELVLPIAEYDHTQGCSITGGYTYRGQQSPNLDGIYFYGDYCTGIIWGLRQDTDGSWAQTHYLSSGLTISSFGQDETGEVYVIDHSGGVFQIIGQ